MIKRLVAFFLSFVLVFMSIPSYATTSVGGWTALDTLTAGATNTINATKTAGGKVLTSAITIAPQAGKVGKFLLKGGGSAALLLAVPQLLGDGVEWVLDPANNAVRYTDPAVENSSNHQYLAVYKKNSDFLYPFTASTRESAALGNCLASGNVFSHMNSNTSFTCNTVKGAWAYNGTISLNPSYDPDAPSEEYKYLPIDTVAAKVISNAEAGHAPSQEAVKAAALEGFAAGEHDAALDAGAVESDVGTENPTDPNNPTDPADPAAPFDPSSIISAINALKALLAGILSSITGLADFFKSDPPPEPKPEDTNIDIPLPDLPTPDTDIAFGGSCPADSGFTANLFGNSFEFVLMPFSKFCPLLSTYIKPVLVVLGSFMAVSIVGGRRDV